MIAPVIVDYVDAVRSLPETVVTLAVSFEDVPRVRANNRVDVERLGEGFWHVTARFGFVEIPDLPSILDVAKKDGVPALKGATYFIERESLVSRRGRNFLGRWRVALLAFMSRNSAHAIDRFNIPSNALVELGHRIDL